MDLQPPNRSMNLRDSLRLAGQLGCDVATLRRTGETTVRHARIDPRFWCRLNLRRKDTARALYGLLKKVWEIQP